MAKAPDPIPNVQTPATVIAPTVKGEPATVIVPAGTSATIEMPAGGDKVLSMDYGKAWIGVGVFGTIANGLSRMLGDLLYNPLSFDGHNWSWFGASVLDFYFKLPQTGFEVVMTTLLTGLAVAIWPNAKKLLHIET